MSMCRDCDATWTGLRIAHCAACHATFTTPAGFDTHRRGGACLTPPAVGMERNDRGQWHAPGNGFWDNQV